MRRVLLGIATLLLVSTLGCGGGSTQPTQCSYSATNQTQSAPAEGASLSTTMTRTGGTCGWSAASDAPWLTIAGPPSGGEGGTLSYSAAANPTSTSRTGHITVSWSGGSTQITVTQGAATLESAACTYVVSDTSPPSFAAVGGTGSATTTVTGNGCSGWTAQTNANWIHITSGGSGSSTGTIRYAIDANSGPARTDKIVVAYPAGSTDINISQSATGSATSSCAYSVGDTVPPVFPLAGGVNTSAVTVNGSGCAAWNTDTRASWIHVTAGTSGSSSGTIRYTVDANSGSPRSNTIVVTFPGGTTDIKISQAGVQAVLSVSPQPCPIRISRGNVLMCTFDGSASTPAGMITNYDFRLFSATGLLVHSGPQSSFTNPELENCGLGVPGNSDTPIDVYLTVTTPFGKAEPVHISVKFVRMTAC